MGYISASTCQARMELYNLIPVGLGKNVDLGFCFCMKTVTPNMKRKEDFRLRKQCSTKIIFRTENGTKNIIYLIKVMPCETKTIVTACIVLLYLCLKLDTYNNATNLKKNSKPY